MKEDTCKKPWKWGTTTCFVLKTFLAKKDPLPTVWVATRPLSQLKICQYTPPTSPLPFISKHADHSPHGSTL
ncbi:hypothetical protein GLYMA_15G271150v4 [Glycine max]|nr:hypothetical protein GLYMA_15G271150v4 [Glycine max]KAH1149076.1 hypothetical protein GYH30_043608 [Glycine max]